MKIKKPNLDLIERRVSQPGSAALKEGIMEGHAAVFNTFSSPDLGFSEVIRPGCFAKTLKESDIRALWNHNPDKVLGRRSAGTLELKEDETGLATKIILPDNSWGKDCRESVSRGDVSQMSFAFRTIRDNWFIDDSQGGIVCRELLEVRLLEVSPCTFPAYPQTDVSARALAQAASAVSGSTDEKVFRALLRLKAGDELRAEEIELLTNFAGNLQKQLTKTEPGNHSEESEPRSHSVEVDVDLLKAQLEIEENRI
jgi:uncharacterized protein